MKPGSGKPGIHEEHRLRLVHAESGATAEARASDVRVRLSREGDELVARFQVRGAAVHVNPAWPTNASQWGLWDYDVVELFVTTMQPTYYEFQVSPLGQYFELEIFEPRKRVNRDFASGFARRAKLGKDTRSWTAELRIPLAKVGGTQGQPVGNAFACLGAQGARTYWSLFLPEQEQPDFHLPQHFQALSFC